MSSHLVAARKLVDDLVRGSHAEVRRASIVAADLAAWVDELGRQPSGGELEAWLGDHRQVVELYASASVLDGLSNYFRPPDAEDAAPASEPDLERQLLETLDPEPFLVYADWLQERGDLFGELIALGVASSTSGTREARERFEAFLDRNDRQLLGGIRKALGSVTRVVWRNGVIVEVHEGFDPLGARVWTRLLDLRVAKFVRTISLVQHTDPDVETAIAERAPALAELRLRLGRLPATLLALPTLRTLSIVVDTLTLAPGVVPATLVRLELQLRELVIDPALRELRVRELVLHGSQWRIATTPFATLAGLALPELAHLELAGLDGTFAAMCDVLARLAMPALRALVLRGCQLRAADVARLVALPIAAQLASLAIVGARLDDAAVAELAPLGRLERLDVSDNELSPAGVAAARAIATTLVVGTQHARGSAALAAIRGFAAGRFDAGEQLLDDDWTDAGVDGDVRWARYRGSSDYELYVTADLSRYGCSCPSRYQPCKHVIALAILAERGELRALPSGGIPARVGYFGDV